MTPLLAQRPRAERGFERIYRRHVADVYRYCFAVLRNQSDAEDVAQTTFMNAYRAYQRGERPRDPHNWLIAIAHNVCRQRFRQSQRRPDEVAYDDGIGDTFVPEDDAPTADDIRRALEGLAFNQRAALVMRELEGRSYAEIAEVLGVTTSAVETLLFRARRALREQLEGSLTCAGAELAISRQLDGRLARDERGQLRAHLRECKECATLARKQRAQRSAIKALGAVPLPASLASWAGGGSAAAGGAVVSGLALKTAAVVAAGAVTVGAGYEIAREPAGAAPGASPQAEADPAPLARAGVPLAVAVPAEPAAGRPVHARTSPDARPAPRPGRAERAEERRARPAPARGRTGEPPGATVAAAAKAKERPAPKARAQAPAPKAKDGSTGAQRPSTGKPTPARTARPAPRPSAAPRPAATARPAAPARPKPASRPQRPAPAPRPERPAPAKKIPPVEVPPALPVPLPPVEPTEP